MICCKQAMGRGKGPPPLLSTVKGLWGVGLGVREFYLWQSAPHIVVHLGRRRSICKFSPKACHVLRGQTWTQGPQERLPAGSLLPHPILLAPGLVAPARFPVSPRGQNSDPAASTLLSSQVLPLTPARPPRAQFFGTRREQSLATSGYANSASIWLEAKELVARKRLPPVRDLRLSEPACSRPVACPVPSRGDRPWPWRQRWRERRALSKLPGGGF